MADFEKIHIEQLDVDNYATWKPRMQFLLVSKGLWASIDTPGAADVEVNHKPHALSGRVCETIIWAL